MGTEHSIDLIADQNNNGDPTPEQVAHYQENTLFTPQEIICLLHKYKQLVGFGTTIKLNDFLDKLHITNSSLGEIMYNMMDTDHSGDVNFEEFLLGMNKFHPDAPLNERIDLCFNAYDGDGSGAIDEEEIRSILEISLTGNTFVELSDAEIENLVKTLIHDYDSTGTGDLDRTEFRQMVLHAPGILDCFTFDVHELVEEESASQI